MLQEISCHRPVKLCEFQQVWQHFQFLWLVSYNSIHITAHPLKGHRGLQPITAQIMLV